MRKAAWSLRVWFFFPGMWWISHWFFFSRRYLLHGHGIQTTYFDRRGNPYRVSIPPHAIAWYRHFTSISSAIEVALGQIYSGVFSVRYWFCSIYYFWWLNLNVEFGRAMEWSWGSRSCWTWPFMAYAPWRWVWSSDPFFKCRSPKRQYYPFFLGGRWWTRLILTSHYIGWWKTRRELHCHSFLETFCRRCRT